MKDIHEYYTEAGKFHGHCCPGLAIGVRAAYEAERAIGTVMQDRHNRIQCAAEAAACWLDGIQYVLGATVGNGALKLLDSGKSAFNFYNPETGKSLRLYLKELPRERAKPELIEYILTAPREDVFLSGPVKRPFPERTAKSPEVTCSVCGETLRESQARYRNGKPLCMDCLQD